MIGAPSSPPLTVVKLGGSLLEAGRAKRWLAHWAAPTGAPVVVVPGGGVFADAVRDAQPRLGFDDGAAHAMAVLAMAQTAMVFHSWCPAWTLGHGVDALRRLAAQRRPALWCPTVLPDTPVGWHVTSDSLAAWLAAQLGAQRLVLVKSVAAPAGSGPAQWQAAGWVDAAFAEHAARFAGDVALLRWDAAF
jgi:aspartokinase-like uncharacterized kinase